MGGRAKTLANIRTALYIVGPKAIHKKGGGRLLHLHCKNHCVSVAVCSAYWLWILEMNEINCETHSAGRRKMEDALRTLSPFLPAANLSSVELH